MMNGKLCFCLKNELNILNIERWMKRQEKISGYKRYLSNSGEIKTMGSVGNRNRGRI